MNNIQDEFISTVSHELRTPLTSIRGFSQTLLNSWDKISDNDKKKFIKIIEEQSVRLIHLVENILSVSKINVERQVLKEIDINTEIKKIVALFSQRRNIITQLNPKIPTSRLDEYKLQQILTNLIDNAIKYSEDTKPVTIVTGMAENNVYIQVKDEGVGIKEEDYQKIFQKFRRLENHLTSKTQGNGLGLYITKTLVENMGGTIGFTSSENKGTVFEVKFPFYNQEEALKCSQKS